MAYVESATVTASVTIPSALSMYIDNDDGKGDVEVTDGGSNIWTKEFELYPGGDNVDELEFHGRSLLSFEDQYIFIKSWT